LGRDREELALSAADLAARGAVEPVVCVPCDLLHRGAPPGANFEAALATAGAELGGLDLVVVTAALFAPREELESDPHRLAAMLDANFTGTLLFLEAARKRLLVGGGGTLCAFSSVAGERGRSPI